MAYYLAKVANGLGPCYPLWMEAESSLRLRRGHPQEQQNI